MRKEGLVVPFIIINFWNVWLLTFIDFSLFTSQRIHINNSTCVLELINVPGTVSGHLRSSAPHVRSVRKDDMLR